MEAYYAVFTDGLYIGVLCLNEAEKEKHENAGFKLQFIARKTAGPARVLEFRKQREVA